MAASCPVVEDLSWNGPAEPAPERQEPSLPRATLAAYVGTYRFAGDTATLTITLEGGSSVGINARVDFVKDASGVVTGLSLGNRKATRVSR